jgi:hypothetical protein
MATDKAIPAPGVFQLPVTGKRDGRYGVVVGHVLVLDDAFTREVLAKYRWHFTRAGYACRDLPRPNRGPCRLIYLHRAVFEHYHGPVPGGLEVDHQDRDKRNNLPGNLRAAPHCINNSNIGLSRHNTSGFRNVHWNKVKGKWQALMRVRGRRISLGYHATAREAADAVNEAYRKYLPEVQIPNP